MVNQFRFGPNGALRNTPDPESSSSLCSISTPPEKYTWIAAPFDSLTMEVRMFETRLFRTTAFVDSTIRIPVWLSPHPGSPMPMMTQSSMLDPFEYQITAGPLSP